MTRLAIIGTAGRGEDFDKLTVPIYARMLHIGGQVAEALPGPVTLVSGGAAWADHVAVSLALHWFGRFALELHLPGRAEDIETARYYHRKFSAKVHLNTLGHLAEIQNEMYCVTTAKGSFKERNARVANSDYFLAMTFGNGPQVKDGGTAHTVGLMREAGKRGWHFDLNTLTLHEVQ